MRMLPGGIAASEPRRKEKSYDPAFFDPSPNTFRVIHRGATNTWAGLVKNAGLFPSIRWPSQANENAAGISKSATIQCHQITIRREPDRNGYHVQSAVDWMVMSAIVMRIKSHISSPPSQIRAGRIIPRYQVRGTIGNPLFLVFQDLCRKGFPGYTLLIIGVLGSRIPLDNLRRTSPCRGTEARSPASSPNPGDSNG